VSEIRNRIRKPVRRSRADLYLLLMLLSFAFTVVETRWFLQLTGYPQLGNKELHIAHVLWGGLLLFIAVLFPLTVVNRWAYPLSAILGGVGVGMFIDEVGKFITRSNDYFYPFAAPIIYVFFLLILLVYLQVRRSPARNPRTEMYYVLDGAMEVLDRDLDAEERSNLEERLRLVASQKQFPDYARLADALLLFLNSDDVMIVEDKPELVERLLAYLKKQEMRWFSRRVMRWSLIVLLGMIGIVGVLELAISLLIVASPQTLQDVAAEIVSAEQQVRGAISLGWYIVRLLLQGIVGLLAVIASILLVLKRENAAVRIGTVALVLSLTTVNLLLFYFDQFGTVSLTISDFAVLLALVRYRRRFLSSPIVNPENGTI
jgi:hypothetical protein